MTIKSILAYAAVLSLSLSSCGENSASPASSAETAAASPVVNEKDAAPGSPDDTTETTASGIPTDISAAVTKADKTGKKTDAVIDMSRYGEGARFYSTDDVYVEWIDVGSVEKMPSFLMITTREQLEYAKVRYPLSIRGDADENTIYHLNSPITEPFEKMTEKYPIEEYTYLLEYVRANGGGYHIIPSGIMIGSDRIYFIDSPDSVFPELEDSMPDVCSDYCYMAAVPKEYLSSGSYPGWEQPDEDNMYQDANYRLSARFTDTDDVYDIYGDTHYIMRTREEYDDFLAMSSQLMTVRGAHVISDERPDLDEAAVLAYFRRSADADGAAPAERRVVIEGNTVTVEYPVGWDDRTGTYMIYAFIPKRFLTAQSYEGWQAPPHTEPKQADIPFIDRSKYGRDALILTSEDIVIYGSHTSCTDFSGKYVMRGEKGISAVWDGLEMYRDDNFRQFVEDNRFNLDFEKYPSECENVIFVQYNNFDYYGSRLHPYALVIDGNKAEFLYNENKDADKSDKRPDSYCFFAAVPKELLGNVDLEGWSVYDEAPSFGTQTVSDGASGDAGEMYYKEPEAKDIVTDPENGVKYVKNQLLVSAFTDADRYDVENIINEVGADIVGYIGLTNDYQIEFRREMTIADLQYAADILDSCSFISCVTLNIVSDADIE